VRTAISVPAGRVMLLPAGEFADAAAGVAGTVTGGAMAGAATAGAGAGATDVIGGAASIGSNWIDRIARALVLED